MATSFFVLGLVLLCSGVWTIYPNVQLSYLPKLCSFLFNNRTTCASPSFIKKDLICLGPEDASSTSIQPVLEHSSGNKDKKTIEKNDVMAATSMLSENQDCKKKSRMWDSFYLGRPTRGNVSSGDLQLHQACEEGKLDLVQNIVINEKADINCRGVWGRSPIMTAAVKGQLSVFEFLINQGCAMSRVDDNEDTLLHVACMGGNVIIVRKLIASGFYDVNVRDKSSATPIMEAVYYGHCELLDFLVHQGCDVMAVNAQKQNILHIACMGGHADMVSRILSYNVTGIMNSRDFRGNTPIMLTMEMNCIGLFHLLLSSGCGLTDLNHRKENILHLASSHGHTDMVKCVLSMRAIDIETRSMRGWTPVMYAVRFHNKDTFNLLVSKGCSLKVTDMFNDNLLHLSARACNVHATKYILNKDILDIESRNDLLMTPIMLSDCIGVFHVLMNSGSNLSAVDEAGNNILHVASEGGRPKIVKHILELNLFDVDSRGAYGRTPVMLAAYNNHLSTVALLVRAGCNVKLADKQGNNILHLACKRENVKLVTYLNSMGGVASLKLAKNSYGRTPSQEARYQGENKLLSFQI